MNVIGEAAGYTCILVDDIVDFGGTLVNAADALIAHGAKEVYAYITHGVLSGGATTRIASSKLKELVITDSIQPTDAVKKAANIRSLSIAGLIADAIGRTAAEEVGVEFVRLAPTSAGWAKPKRAHHPARSRGKMVGTAQARLCPPCDPYDFFASSCPGRGTRFMMVRVNPPSTVISSPLT